MSCTIEQRDAAYALANRIRIENGAFKKQLRAMTTTEAIIEAAATLLDPQFPHDRIPVIRLLMSVPEVGETTAIRMCKKAGIVWGDRHIGKLTPRQRGSLAMQLMDREERRCSRS